MASQIEEIDPQDVWNKRTELVIIDVRRPDEFDGELGHIPGAKLMVLDTLPDRIDEIPADKTIVFVCRSGGRSGKATEFAMEHGLEHVLNMKGGMLAWNELKLQVEGQAR